jgi:hypothetical protein
MTTFVGFCAFIILAAVSCAVLAALAIAYYTTSGIKEELARPLYSFLVFWS